MTELLGRRAECDAVAQLLARARSGRSGVLVVRGEAGIGKTVLLEHARDAATTSGFRVQPAVGAESETQFAFAGLHQLCAPLLDRGHALPEPQGEALHVALGLREGTAPDRFFVGLAVLNLLAEVAEEAPLLCLVDDAQWLDQASAQVLAFVARRVVAEQLALVFAVRDHLSGDTDPLTGLPELRLDGLGEADARTLLAAAVRTPLADEVRDRIVAEARGNPLALLELPRGGQLVGGYELPDALSVPHRVEDSFRRRSATLPSETQLLLLVAAAEPTGDASLLRRAADHLGIAREAAAAAESAGLLEIGARVRFPHPLVRSAVYRAATAPDQRRAHGALAAHTDQLVDPDRRAWHRGQSLLGTDEDAAADLERSAGRARARGGLAAAAAFLQRAVELTPEPAARAARALLAAQTAHEAGAFEKALELLALAATGPLDELQRVGLTLMRAEVGFFLGRGGDGLQTVLDAAATLAPLDPALSRQTYLQALAAAFQIGGQGDGRGVRDVAGAARAAPPPAGPPGPVDLLLDGLATACTRGYVAGAPRLKQALAAFRADGSRDEGGGGGDHTRWLSFACGLASALFDDESLFVLTDRLVRATRGAGALTLLNVVLQLKIATLTLSGELAHAAELVDEQAALTRAIGVLPVRNGQILLAAWSGDEAESTAQMSRVLEASDYGNFAEVAAVRNAQAVLQNSLGNYPAALETAERAGTSAELWYATHALPEIVEAASRAGRTERAAAALDELSALGRCRVVVDLARAHLVYGEWLRREGRRQDAREQLRTAHRMLSDMGAQAFAARAARELRATGERPVTRTARDTDELTLQELHVARLVATGATSREVATQLFLSPRTIEAHLRNIFRKLGITSRRQLRELPFP